MMALALHVIANVAFTAALAVGLAALYDLMPCGRRKPERRKWARSHDSARVSDDDMRLADLIRSTPIDETENLNDHSNRRP